MIQHGAQEIILTCDQEGEDLKASLDDIIERSLKKTEEFNQKLKQIEKKFDMNDLFFNKLDEDSTKYKKLLIEGDEEQDQKNAGKQGIPKQIIPLSIDLLPERRERRLQVVAEHKPTTQPKKDNQIKKKGPKGWKQSVGGGFDHQFFDNARLDELEIKETNWEKYKANPDDWTNGGKEVPPEYTNEDAEEFK